MTSFLLISFHIQFFFGGGVEKDRKIYVKEDEKVPKVRRHLAYAGDAVHLAPGEDSGVPAVAVLVVVALPLAAAAGQNVQPAPGHPHVRLFVGVQLDQIAASAAAAGLGAAACLAAAERPGPHGLADGAVQGWTGLLEAVHAEVTLL
jgi:hypothetical protein